MKFHLRHPWLLIAACFFAVICYTSPSHAQDEFPQSNAWYRATPSVVWCGDPESTTTLEVHITDRQDVARVWMTELGTAKEEEKVELFDDGTHGDLQAGDNIFTLSEVQIPCNPDNFSPNGWRNWIGMLRVELTNGTQIGNNYGLMVGLADSKYKGQFETVQLADGLTATAYALFIDDSSHTVMDDYPIATVYCGTSNFAAYQKLYSVFPDQFDMAAVMPGMPIFRPKDLAENVPYNVMVSNQVQNIGVGLFDDTAKFGSSGRLKSSIYLSFGSIGVFDHEIAHTWGPAIGQSIGLLSSIYTGYNVNQAHWNEYADMQGQMGSYYFDSSGAVGHFAYQGDDIWSLIPNYSVEPYSPLELYTMGLIPAEEVPPIHILASPDTSDPEAITAASYRTVTMDEIIAAEGGVRVPAAADAQKDFSLAFIVTQDTPYNDAAYAYFSLIAYQLTSQEPPQQYSSFAPFYWATGGRGTLETRLPLELATGPLPGQPEPTAEPAPTDEPAAIEPTEAPPREMQDTGGEPQETLVGEQPPAAENPPAAQDTPGCSLLPVGFIAIPALFIRRAQKQKKKKSS